MSMPTITTDAPTPTAQEIADWLRLFVARDAVTELRILGVRDDPESKYPPYTIAGYFDLDHLPEMARLALAWTPKAEGVYMAINPVDPGLLALASNKVAKRPKSTANDSHILRRCWVVLDSDPTRRSIETGKPLPPGISSTDAEKALALVRLDTAVADRTAAGWPEPTRGDSGNGYHAWYRIDLPTDDEGLVERVLKALDAQYSDDLVKIDTSLYNPSRIIKLYGTMARKGDSTPERPHRWSRVLTVPERIDVVSREMLEALAASAPSDPHPTRLVVPADPWIVRTGGPSAVDRARAYVFAFTFPESIEGQNGHGRLYHVACVLVDGFGLSYDQAMPIFREWNAAKAVPPEGDEQLDHKLQDAIKNHPGPSCSLLDAPPRNGKPKASASNPTPTTDATTTWPTIPVGSCLQCHDRPGEPENFGFVTGDEGATCEMVFRPGEEHEHHKTIPKSMMTWPDGRPLTDTPEAASWPPLRLEEAPPSPPFPIEVFPEPLQKYAREVAKTTLTPLDFVGASMLTVAAGAIGQSVNIQIRRDWTEAPTLNMVAVALAGKGKSPVIRTVRRPLTEIDARLR